MTTWKSAMNWLISCRRCPCQPAAGFGRLDFAVAEGYVSLAGEDRPVRRFGWRLGAMTKGVQDRMVEVERVRDAFHSAIYSASSPEAAMALTTTDCVLVNLPAGSGAASGDGLRRYLADDVLPHLPADLTFRRISRTGDRWRVAQEDIVSFTHDLELPWLLPGIAPTHRRAEVLAISVVTVQRSLITSHRTLWDQTALLAQLHVDPADVTSDHEPSR
jgi:carboxymethylenebutenolidase